MDKTKRKRRASPKQKQTKEQVPQRGFKEAHVLTVVNKIQNERKKTYFVKTKTHRGASAAAWFHFGQWRIRGWRIIRVRSWKALSRNIAFFCFHRSHYFFFLTDCQYIQSWSTSCFAFWELIEPRALVTFRDSLPSITTKFNDFLLV